MKIDNNVIKKIVSESFGIEVSDFVIGTRKIKYSYPRFAYFTLCRQYTLMTLEEIGETVLLNHSTVSRSLVRHEDLMETLKVYKVNYINALCTVKQLKDSK